MELLTKASYDSAANQREKDNLQVAYNAACEGMVLLKNDGCLPFSGKKVALYGAGASMTIKGGTGSGEVNERHSQKNYRIALNSRKPQKLRLQVFHLSKE